MNGVVANPTAGTALGTTLLDVPENCIHAILRFLPLPDLLRVAAASKHLHAAHLTALRCVAELNFETLAGRNLSHAVAWAWACPDLVRVNRLLLSGHAAAYALQAARGPRASAPDPTSAVEPSTALLLEPALAPAFSTTLQHLTIDSCKVLTDADVEALLTIVPSVLSLDLERCTKLTSAAAASIARHCATRLRSLVCRDWPNLHDSGFALLRGCTALEELTLDGCLHVSNEGLLAVARGCGALRHLSMARSHAVTDRLLEALAGHEQLRTLRLRQCPKIGRVGQLGSCPALTSLDLTGCPRVTDGEVMTLLLGAGAHMRSLYLGGSVGISGAVVAKMGSLCPLLENLSLRGLSFYDHHLQGLAANCKTLQSFDATWCTKLTNEGVMAILMANPNLKVLDIEGLYNITDALLEVLAQYAPGITALNIRMCVNLTTDALVACVLATQLRSLHVSGMMDDSRTTDMVARVRQVRPACKLHW